MDFTFLCRHTEIRDLADCGSFMIVILVVDSDENYRLFPNLQTRDGPKSTRVKKGIAIGSTCNFMAIGVRLPFASAEIDILLHSDSVACLLITIHSSNCLKVPELSHLIQLRCFHCTLGPIYRYWVDNCAIPIILY